MKLYIGNKNYSSWSMRPWVLLKAFGIPFEEVKLRFDFTPGSTFYQALKPITPTGKVPVLVEDDGFAVWDTLAITEAIAEQFPEHAIWPLERQQRARARSLCAEMHAGFGKLRGLCPMNVDVDLRAVGAKLLSTEPGLHTDLARLDALWCEALAASGGPFLFGAFGATDAYFAPLVMRVTRYGLPVSAPAAAYVAAIEQHPAVAAWVKDAMAEQDFLDFEEPYRQQA
ncbi:glutathione S-transferase family protein [Roseateles oligotrophus]|uniref:Glutathione S-transferase family protein n=1 Tax=Roseateles oligotrophus TaxID=1769250 RepID=A0ABT2YHP9_9BURK|nr:glutathione S-transferase family protein [Roseateles oligotrophus]MCV2369548.1 glutathione S-transferase family protein [Roseateles oligotrophus]